MTGITIWTPDKRRELAEACADDWPRLMFDGFGIMVSPEQEEAYIRLGKPGPRLRGEHKVNWLSGGQRAGKTVFAFGYHADATLYKRGLDGTDKKYWRNYQYGTLAIAPTDELTLRLWTIGDEISKGASDAQYDRKARRSRGGAFIGMFKAGRNLKGNGIWRWDNGAITDFRSSEGYAYRLEGGQWWLITWDEWASQPDREIHKVLTDVLFGRSRDHDAKIMPMAWPKEETERHLIAAIREIEAGRDRDSQVIYLSARKAPWTNKRALAVELRGKDKQQIKRTIDGEPAGGAQKEFKQWMTDNCRVQGPVDELPDFEQFGYFDSWDLGLANDDTVGGTWRIPVVDGRRVVHPMFKARLIAPVWLKGGPNLAPDTITYSIQAKQMLYRSEVGVDATGLGGVAAVRSLKTMKPRPYAFVAKSNDRIHGNMRLAAITNGLEMLTWGRPVDDDGIPIPPDEDDEPSSEPWGLVEIPNMPDLTPLFDQLHNFDRDDAKIVDDWVWMMLIGLWYIRRFYVVDDRVTSAPVDFDLRRSQHVGASEARSGRRRRARLIGNDLQGNLAVAPSGIRLIYQRGDPRNPANKRG